MIDKQFLIDFETEVKERYEAGEIAAPVHLSSNNEEQLIKIFEDVNKDDWVFSSWRNHYHALLHGIPRDTLMDLIVRGKSMSVYSKEPKFYSSAIVGGIIPIALGTAKALKMKQDDTLNKNYYRDNKRKVWCFIGDMTFESGIFYDAEFEKRAHQMLGDDIHKIWSADELCTSQDAFFVASGVCSGWLPGVKFHDNKAIVSSRVIFGETGESKLITNEYDL